MATLKSPYSPIEVPNNVNVVDFIFSHSTYYPECIAVINGNTGEKTTYGQLVDYTRWVSSSLVRGGLKKGEVVAICSPNCPEYLWAMYGAMRAGASVTGINPAATNYELQYALNLSQVVVLFVSSKQLPAIHEARKEYKGLRAIYTLDYMKGYTCIQELLHDDGTYFSSSPTEGSDLALLPLSSGTTGLFKAVQLTHRNIIANILQSCHPELGLWKYYKEVTVAALPFCHMAGMHAIANTTLFTGGTVVTLPKFDFLTWLELLSKHKVTILHTVPPMAIMLAKRPETLNFDLSSIKNMLIGAAPVGDELIALLLKKIPDVRLIQGYGMTELTAGTCRQGPGCNSHGAAGKLFSNCEAKVVDNNTGKTLGPGEDGELCFRGPNVFTHYKTGSNTVKYALTEDGWFHTGDIGHYDQNGEIYITDRLKELIKYKAYQVSPAELEDLLLNHPDLDDAAVIGVPDETAGELPRAYVVRKPGSNITEAEVKKFVAERVSHYKHLRGGVVFTDQVPKSPTGKILHRILSDQAKEDMNFKL